MSDVAQNMESMAGVPIYPDVKLYGNVLLGMRIWEGDGWKDESMSWKESCYIHSGLSNLLEITMKGPEAQKLLSKVSINNCYNWPVGMSKHLVMCDDNGFVANHGLTVRDSEDAFRSFACFPWAIYQNDTLKYDVEVKLREIFILQIAGPKSLEVLEAVTGENLHDVKFLQVRPTKVPGFDTEIEVSRIGMVGNLAYELRGAIEAGPDLYDRVYQTGKLFGMKRLGWRTYVVNHVEGGFPQLNCTFLGSCYSDSNFLKSPYGATVVANFSGSIDPTDHKARYRTPQDVGWSWMAKSEDDFIGCKAVMADKTNPRRTIVTLRWNPEDVIDIYSSLFKPGEDYKTLALPCGQPQPAGGHADFVIKNGEKIGVSSGTTYSYYFREVISHCTIDINQAKIGNEVIVLWGDYGKRIKEVRATVERYPYLDLPRNQAYDLNSIPYAVTGG